MKPNLFKFATSELSNDAILCWMLEWGNYRNSALYQLSNDLVNAFMGKNRSNINIESIRITRQYKHIDILLEINDKYIIVIEDKIDTTEHSNQLQTYKKVIGEDFKYISDNNKFFIYVKIGDESSYKQIESKGYKVIRRKDILDVLEKYKDVENDILGDYYGYLREIDCDVESYRSTEIISNWSNRAWQGFYSTLQEEMNIEKACWQYVNNRRGGFWGFWWNSYEHIYNNEVYYYTYLQIEETRIAFKVEVENKEYQSEIRNHVWSNLKDIIDEIDMKKYKAIKTSFSQGTWMTIAEINDLTTEQDIRNAMKAAEDLHLRLKDILNK